MRSFTAKLAGATLLALFAAVPASAESGGGMRLVLAGSDGPNLVQLSNNAQDDLLIESPAGVTAPPAPCVLETATRARCPAGSVAKIRAAFLAGDDTLTVTATMDVPIEVSGGNGDDSLMGGSRRDQISGDGGDDTLIGHGGRDQLAGGAGNDSCIGGGAVDSASGCETQKSVP